MIEGSLTDLQYAAKKIYDYCEWSGHTMKQVRVSALCDGSVFINIETFDEYDREIYGHEIVHTNDLRSILVAGYRRAEMMMAAGCTKH